MSSRPKRPKDFDEYGNRTPENLQPFVFPTPQTSPYDPQLKRHALMSEIARRDMPSRPIEGQHRPFDRYELPGSRNEEWPGSRNEEWSTRDPSRGSRSWGSGFAKRPASSQPLAYESDTKKLTAPYFEDRPTTIFNKPFSYKQPEFTGLCDPPWDSPYRRPRGGLP